MVVTQAGRVLTFVLGAVSAQTRLRITYETIVGLDVKPGNLLSTVTASMDSPLGAVTGVATATAAITVAPSSLATTQVIVGRVFDDDNANGLFDNGEVGLPGARIFLPTGQAATTDANGMYSFPVIKGGTTSLTLDAMTVPGYQPLDLGPSDTGWSRLVRTPLGAGSLLRQNFAMVNLYGLKPKALPLRSGEGMSPEVPAAAAAMAPGLTPLQPRASTRRLEIFVELPELGAGGRERTVVTVSAFDENDSPVQSGSVHLQTSAGAILLPNGPLGDEAARLIEQSDPASAARLRDLGDLAFCVDGPATGITPGGGQDGSAPLRDGQARFCVQSDLHPGPAFLIATAEDGSNVRTTGSLVFVPTRTTPIVAAVGEVAFGPAEQEVADATSESLHKSGAIFLQTPVLGGSELTVAATTAPSINAALGVDRLSGLDPADRVYGVYGDSSGRQEFALSSEKVFARLDMGQSSVMFGDLKGDLPRAGESGLLDVTRPMTGAQLNVASSADRWFRVQAARPDTAFAREVFSGGIGGSVQLSNTPLVSGSEVLTVETRDRRRPDVIVSRHVLTRTIDYTINTNTGAIIFVRPLQLFADGLNVVHLVAAYDYVGAGIRNGMFVARGESVLADGLFRVRGVVARQSTDADLSFGFGGVGVSTMLPRQGQLHAEFPVSQSAIADGRSETASAFRMEAIQPLPFRSALFKLQAARTGQRFDNPYGAVAVPGSTVADASLQFTPTATGLFNVHFVDESMKGALVDASRRTIGAEWIQQLSKTLRGSLQFDLRKYADHREARRIGSQMVTALADWQVTPRLQTSIRREQNLQTAADPTYPNQTLLAGRFAIVGDVQVVATQRWSSAPVVPITGTALSGLQLPLSKSETTVGLESRVARHTSVTSRYQIENGIGGVDAFAVVGAQTRVPVNQRWSVDGGFERATHVSGAGGSYTNSTAGLALTPEGWVATAHYQYRDGQQRRGLFTSGLAGRLTSGVTVLASYRYADASVASRRAVLDATMALAVRPVRSDRAGMLFSWNHGNSLSSAQVVGGEPTLRRTRVSADGYYQPTRPLEIYSRLAYIRTPVAAAGSSTGTVLLQERAQYRILPRVDAAFELRVVQVRSPFARARFIGAGDAGFWFSPDLRIGLGYTKAPWADPNATGIAVAPGSGGFYVTFSSKLSSLFNLLPASRGTAPW